MAENRKWEAKRCIEGTALISMCRVVWSRDICWDGVHLTARGCRKFYEKIAKYIETMKEIRDDEFRKREGERGEI